jgi:hypothetical protein
MPDLMPFSQAIRLGALITKPYTGLSDLCNPPQATCVLGAALVALGLFGKCDHKTSLAVKLLVERYPFLKEVHECPVGQSCGFHGNNNKVLTCELSTILFHLNDRHRWTRERIADWVESIEPRLALKRIRSDVAVSWLVEAAEVFVFRIVVVKFAKSLAGIQIASFSAIIGDSVFQFVEDLF